MHTTVIYYPTIKKNKNYTAKGVLYLGSKRHNAYLQRQAGQLSSDEWAGVLLWVLMAPLGMAVIAWLPDPSPQKLTVPPTASASSHRAPQGSVCL